MSVYVWGRDLRRVYGTSCGNNLFFHVRVRRRSVELISRIPFSFSLSRVARCWDGFDSHLFALFFARSSGETEERSAKGYSSRRRPSIHPSPHHRSWIKDFLPAQELLVVTCTTTCSIMDALVRFIHLESPSTLSSSPPLLLRGKCSFASLKSISSNENMIDLTRHINVRRSLIAFPGSFLVAVSRKKVAHSYGYLTRTGNVAQRLRDISVHSSEVETFFLIEFIA